MGNDPAHQLLFWGVGALFAALQAVGLLLLNAVRAEIAEVKSELLRGSDRMRAHEGTISEHEARIRLLERDHDRNHPPYSRRNDPPGYDPTHERCRHGERKT